MFCSEFLLHLSSAVVCLLHGHCAVNRLILCGLAFLIWHGPLLLGELGCFVLLSALFVAACSHVALLMFLLSLLLLFRSYLPML